jgi:hypothetical protein
MKVPLTVLCKLILFFLPKRKRLGYAKFKMGHYPFATQLERCGPMRENA